MDRFSLLQWSLSGFPSETNEVVAPNFKRVQTSKTADYRRENVYRRQKWPCTYVKNERLHVHFWRLYTHVNLDVLAQLAFHTVGPVASLLRSFTCCKPTNQRTAHLYIHEHTIQRRKPLVFSQGYFTGCIRAHRKTPGPFSAQPMLHTLLGDLNNSVKQCEIPQNPVNDPFKKHNLL